MRKNIVSIIMASLLVISSINIGGIKVNAVPLESNTINLNVNVDSTVIVDTTSIIENNYLGVGVQWDMEDAVLRDLTDAEWQKIFDRVDNMKLSFVRCMLGADTYCKGLDSKGKPIYYWDSAQMQRLYKILNYCQAHNIQVIIGEWNKPSLGGAITNTDDPKWASIIGDFMDHMLKVKKYSVIKFYNMVNEPNGSWSKVEGTDPFKVWKKAITNLYSVFVAKGFADKVKIVGPDSTGADDWLNTSVDQLSNVIGTYELHRYATDDDVLNGNIETMVNSKRDYIDKNDPNGTQKQFYMGEAGIIDGKIEANDQQPRVKDFDYGVLMSDYAIQSIRGGQAGMISWMLDDSMHISPAYTPENQLLKTWGLWNSLGDVADQALRPWYYTSSLLSKYFPKGSKTVYASASGVDKLRVTAAIIPKGSNNDMTIAVVNDSDTPRVARVIVPAALSNATLNEYHYFNNDRPTDSNGYAVPADKLNNVDLTKGVDVTLPSKGVIILTTMNNGKSVKLSKNGANLALNKVTTASSIGYYDINRPGNVVDGDKNTSWVSKSADPQWVSIDLGSSIDINRVKVNWDDNSARSYKIQVSNDNTVWTDIYSITTGTGGINDIVFPSTKAKYVRIYGKLRNSSLGYAIREVGVYNVPNAALTPLPPAPPTKISDPINDFNFMASYTSGLTIDTGNPDYFSGDIGRVKRGATTSENIVYNLDNIKDVKVKAYFAQNKDVDGILSFSTSIDGNTWSPLSVSHSDLVPTTGGWSTTTYTEAGAIPAGTAYIKIDWAGGDFSWSPEIAQIDLNSDIVAQ